ncbi:hypothetical protein [Pseudomonas sp. LA5]|uniref:hypothetical protein n=1 Tax=Pseudomonas sp. LA5 TaxID=3027850 RepID=UPI003FD4FBF9
MHALDVLQEDRAIIATILVVQHIGLPGLDGYSLVGGIDRQLVMPCQTIYERRIGTGIAMPVVADDIVEVASVGCRLVSRQGHGVGSRIARQAIKILQRQDIEGTEMFGVATVVSHDGICCCSQLDR